MSIIIGADFVPTKTNSSYFENGDVENLLGKDLLEILRSADFRIFNMEIPLTDCDYNIEKWGPNLSASKECIELYKRLNVNLLTLANNHILDKGKGGLLDTINVLSEARINFIGAGSNLFEASRPYVFKYRNKSVGVYGCCEHEFSIANNDKCGAAPFSLDSYDIVENLKKNNDYVIVLYHGGKEHYRYPSPDLQKRCRKFVNKGADLVVCQHSHCIGCEEKFNDGTIIYGQGNFLFDLQSNEFWNTGLLIKIYNNFQIDYIPIAKVGKYVRLAQEKEKILSEFFNRSKNLEREGFIEQNYGRFADEMLPSYLSYLSGARRSVLFKILNRLLGEKFLRLYIDYKYSKSNLLALRNYIETEAHSELLLQGINNLIDKK